MDPSKFAVYKENLKEVEDALILDPSNEDLLKVRDDLRELLDLHIISNDRAVDAPILEGEDIDDSGVIGRTCVISATFQYAVVTKVVSRTSGTRLPSTLAVIILGDDEEAQVDASEVRLLGPYDAHALHIGSEVQALYNDG